MHDHSDTYLMMKNPIDFKEDGEIKANSHN